MPSSAGSSSLERRSALALAGVPLAALLLSVLLAFASALPQRPPARGAVKPVETTAQTRAAPARRTSARTTSAPTAEPAAPETAAISAGPAAEPAKTSSLAALLAPWAIGADVLALLGLIAVLALRRAARRPRGARR
jgi:hypothetical protein